MNFLPFEIQEKILQFVEDPVPCHFVCRLWRKLLLAANRGGIQCFGVYTIVLAMRGDWQLIRWACKSGADIPERVVDLASASGNLEILVWFAKKGIVGSHRTYGLAAANGHLHILKWLATEDECWQRFASYTNYMAMRAYPIKQIQVSEWVCQETGEVYSWN